MENSCLFCDRSKFEDLIIHETGDFLLVAGLGQITDGGYALLVSKQHIPCMGELTERLYGKNIALGYALCRALTHEYAGEKKLERGPWPVTVFEHGVAGQSIPHAHLHFLPVALDLAERVRRDFPLAEIDELQYAAEPRVRYEEKPKPYLFWTTPAGKGMVCWNPPAPRQYLRTVAAELLGRPERANWREADPELDRRLVAETVRRLKPYFL
ncbi:MAG TPA: hypothetical protein VNG29_01500 [Candidatus Paceibacterota bacterium]|nr:hypothetical protein [Candidatus Paceibacterota bacterium]